MRIAPVQVRGSVTQATLRLMQDHVKAWSKHPYMVQLARAICAKYGAKGPKEEARAVWRWIRDNIAYRLDPVGAEWVQDPFETSTISRAGDCDDMATLAGALLGAIGHPCKMAAVKWENQSDFSHAVCLDKLASCVVDPVSSAFEPWPAHGVPTSAIMEA